MLPLPLSYLFFDIPTSLINFAQYSNHPQHFHDMRDHIMAVVNSLLYYSVLTAVSLANFSMFDVALASNPTFIILYENLAYRISSSGGANIALPLRNLIVAILALLLLELQSALFSFLIWVIRKLKIFSSHVDTARVTAREFVDPTPRNRNVVRLLGDEGFTEVRRRILQSIGQYPPLDSFPILDAPSLRPYHRFSDPALYDRELLGLVRPTYHKITGKRDRSIGYPALFVKADKLLDNMDRQNTSTPLPISLQRHPRLIHSHPFMAHQDSFPKMTEVVFLYQNIIKGMSPVINPLHRELRVLSVYLLYLLGCLEQAAACDDLVNCIESLELIDNVTTSLRGLLEVAYSARENAHKATSS